MANTSHVAGARVATAAVIVLLLGACGTSTDSTNTTPDTAATTSAASTPSATSPSSASPSSAAPVATNVAVIEKEFSITLDKTSFTPGTYTFTIQNQGSFPHNLTIEGPGLDSTSSPNLTTGESGSLKVALQKGSYELWCSVPGHKDSGMKLKITVG